MGNCFWMQIWGQAADEMDLNLRTKAPTLKKLAIKRRMELESMGEELRVLYVAMTRAKRGSCNDRNRPFPGK